MARTLGCGGPADESGRGLSNGRPCRRVALHGMHETEMMSGCGGRPTGRWRMKMRDTERKGRIGILRRGRRLDPGADFVCPDRSGGKSRQHRLFWRRRDQGLRPGRLFHPEQGRGRLGQIFVSLAGRDLAFRQRRESRSVQTGAGQIRAAIWRPLRGWGLVRNDHHEHRSEGMADHRGQALSELRSWCGRRLRKEPFQGRRLARNIGPRSSKA